MPNPIADPFVEIIDTDVQSRLVLIDATADGVATVTINRPERKNALNDEVIAALSEAFSTLAAADGVRVVFLTGAGASFSAGADLEWMRDAVDRAESDNQDDAMKMAVMLKHLHDLPQLTVALVNGPAFGGGAGLAAACDMAVATADSTFAFSEVKLGLVAATISPHVIAAIGARRARGLFASGRVFDAAHALHIGLIDEIAADADALGPAQDRIAAEALLTAPGAVRESKRLVDHIAGRPLDHGLLEDTARYIARARVGPEGQEGVRAFLARRTPDWQV